MKAMVQALWLFTTACGDAIIVIITALNLFNNLAINFLAYAGTMLVVIAIFALMCQFYYQYNYYTSEAESDAFPEETTDGEQNGFNNSAYAMDPIDEKQPRY